MSFDLVGGPVDYAAWATRNANEQARLFVEALSGPNFATTTLVTTLQGSAVQSWTERAGFDLQAFVGQTIKLRFRVDDDWGRQSKARIARITTGASSVPPSPSARSSCIVYAVPSGIVTTFTTPNTPYIVRLLQRDSNALLRFEVGNITKYLGATGDSVGGNLPRNASGGLALIVPPVPTAGVDYSQPIYAEVCTLSSWQNLISFRPSQNLQQAVAARGGLILPAYVHKLEDALGNINLDYYPVQIDNLPFKPANPNDPCGAPGSNRFSASQFMEFVRLHLNECFIDTTRSFFRPYSEKYSYVAVSDSAWDTSNPLGTVLSISLRKPIGNSGYYIPVDRGSVLTASYSNSSNWPYWRFSTIFTQADDYHPVSGNREFGLEPNGDDAWIFYTRGADRTTTRAHYLSSGTVFDSADLLWISLQVKVAQFVTNHNGSASVANRDSVRYPWKAVCGSAWRPTTQWIDAPQSSSLTDLSACG